MGIFTIDCSEARQVMNSFTTGGTEATLMFYFEARRTIDVPTLQLTGSSEEAQSWLRFVQTVQPQQSP